MSRPRLLYTIDAETDPFCWQPDGTIDRSKPTTDIRAFIWGIYGEGKFRTFTDPVEMLSFLGEKHAIVYAHNGGKFDYFFLLEFLSGIVPLKIIHGRVSQFGYKRCIFRDSVNIIPTKLSAYKKEEIDYTRFTRDKRAGYMKEIIAYLEKDCIYLYELVDAFRKKYGGMLTLAGTALKTYKKMEQVEIPKTTRGFFNQFKPFYHGGRVEALKKGVWKSNTLKLFDINSAYPFAMKHFHPWGDNVTIQSYLPSDDDTLSRSFIDLDARSLWAFPYLDPKHNKLSFPNDDQVRNFLVTGWEYIAARETSRLDVRKINRVYTFQEKKTFGGYIDHFFKEKAESPEGSPERLFAKLMLNSLVGPLPGNGEGVDGPVAFMESLEPIPTVTRISCFVI